ncbi:MAG: hemerythrin domain-containing protein [Syntrophobacteraceae bacterium]|nr:hemerythrin domain-containing protein [Syntrophobacteraceae bacterium]
MIPIGPLMREHRLIEQMISLMKAEVLTIASNRQANPAFIENAVDFFRTYGDRCHHGKEEEILFARLRGKKLSPAHERIVSELLEDHRLGRQTVGELLDANDRYKSGSVAALDDLGSLLGLLVAFYPEHIAKEDKTFFSPCMEYFTKPELQTMLAEFWEFDRKLIHEKYGSMVAELEKRLQPERVANNLQPFNRKAPDLV